jgi:hypothetical protein
MSGLPVCCSLLMHELHHVLPLKGEQGANDYPLRGAVLGHKVFDSRSGVPFKVIPRRNTMDRSGGAGALSGFSAKTLLGTGGLAE